VDEAETSSQTKNVLDNMLDVADVPPSLVAEDGLDQTFLLSVIDRSNAIHPGIQRHFEKERVHSMPLSSLRKTFLRQDEWRAVNTLTRRARIVLESSDIVDPYDPNLIFYCEDHYLDYLLVVGGRLGLHAIIPNVDSDMNYCFRFSLQEQNKMFRPKFARLGFDPTNRMLFIGYLKEENVWLVMAPMHELRMGSIHDHRLQGSNDLEHPPSQSTQCVLHVCLSQGRSSKRALEWQISGP
jgi:hypothetical protein